MANLNVNLTVSPEYLAALTQLSANFDAVANLLAANQQLLTEFLQRSPQLVKAPLDREIAAQRIEAIAKRKQELLQEKTRLASAQ